MNEVHAKKMIDLGAKFIVSASLDEGTMKYCMKNSVPVIPGAITPTEIQRGVNLGLYTLKYFPAMQMDGLNYLHTISAPYQDVRFVVTGGLDFKQIEVFSKSNRVAACGGVWMFCEEYDASPKPFDEMLRLLEKSKQIIKRARGK